MIIIMHVCKWIILWSVCVLAVVLWNKQTNKFSILPQYLPQSKFGNEKIKKYSSVSMVCDFLEQQFKIEYANNTKAELFNVH